MAKQFPYPVTRPFGVYDPAYSNYPDSKHPGCDYGTGNNTPLPAKMSGKVTIYARGNTTTGRGNEVIITSGATQIKYCHLNRIDVSNGQTVTVGQTIGLSGWTGYVLPKSEAGAHLHFEVLINGVYTDPEKWTGEDMYDGKTAEQWYQEANYWHQVAEDRQKLVNPTKEDIVQYTKEQLGRDPTDAEINQFTSQKWESFVDWLTDNVPSGGNVTILPKGVYEFK